MGIKKYKPTSAGRRFMTGSDFSEVTTSKPERSLLEPMKKSGGRNNRGRITVRHHGGGEGRSKGRHPVTPWGKPTKGYRTRQRGKASDKFIVKRRKK